MWINEIKWTLPVSHDNLIVKNIFSKCGSPTHPSDFLLFSSPLSTRLLIWPDTCFTLQHVNVKGTSLASVRTPTRIIIWSDVLDGAHGAPDNALKCALTWSCPSKNLRPEDGAGEEKAAPHNALNHTRLTHSLSNKLLYIELLHGFQLDVSSPPQKKRPPFFSLEG